MNLNTLIEAIENGYSVLFEAENINKNYLIRAAGNADEMKKHKTAIISMWNSLGMDAVIKNDRSKQRIINLLTLMNIKESGSVNDSILHSIHDLASNNQLNILDKLNSDSSPSDMKELLRSTETKNDIGTDLSEDEKCTFYRVKTYKDFGDGYKWIYALDESGEPIGFMPSKITFKTMNHCGNEPSHREGDIYYELRKNDRPILTTILDKDGKIRESKGKNNSVPKEKAEIKEHVKWFMRHENVKGTDYGHGYAADSNFTILQYLEDDDFDEIESNFPHLIDETIDKPILEWKRKLKNGEASEEDVVKHWENSRRYEFRLEHLRGVLGKIPFSENQLIEYILSGKLEIDEIVGCDHKLLTPSIQKLFIDDNDGIRTMLDIYINVPNNIIDVSLSSEYLREAIQIKDKDIINKLIQSGSMPGRNSLYYAIKTEDKDIVTMLIQAEAPLTEYLLRYAIETKDKDIINMISQIGAKPCEHSLKQAIRTKDKDIINMTIQLGAKPDINSLDFALLTRDKDIINMISQIGAKPSPVLLSSALGTRDKELINIAIQLGAKPHESSLNYAIKTGDIDIIEKVIQLGAKPDGNNFYEAMQTRDMDIIDMFLKVGLEPDSRALNQALLTRDINIVNKFIQLGAKPDKDSLDLATITANPKIIDMIKGAME